MFGKNCILISKVRDDALAIVWVGTKDVLKDRSGFEGCQFKKLVGLLKRVFLKLIFVNLPPILNNTHAHKIGRIIKINDMMQSYKSPKIQILDAFSICEGRAYLYEKVMGRNKRQDLIHLNRSGFELLAKGLETLL